MKRRVVVTGLGAVTPLGNDVDSFWAGIRAGKVGIGEITKFDTTDFKAKLAAEVKDFVAKDRMDFKSAKRMELFSQYAVVAAQEALEDAKIDMNKEDPFRVGVIVGSGIGSLQSMEREEHRMLEKGPSRVDPLLVPKMITNMAAGNVSIATGARGKCTNVVTACASGTNCIGDAYRAIQYGDADVMIAGGTEGSVCPIGVAGFTSLTALTTCDDPMRASIPFDKERSGFVMGEGAGVVIMEELERAKARGANILAEVVGYGATADAYHITSPIEDGSGAARAMADAMKEAGVNPDQVEYINAHGTSTHHNDLFETRAIKAAFGEAAKKVKINSTKSMVGHLLGAAGGVEFIVCVKSILDGFIHQTVGTRETEEDLDLDYVIGSPVEQEVNYAMSNSLGFGGHNATLLIKKYQD
ncbi:MAG TPA: beta-ketoacyl-ACP synthase II [Candidatus Pelethocola excrementipullorum]|nr:beta-ketoacyl-ACP synthase II [Candidatus Pelethocola excrementipullorum]